MAHRLNSAAAVVGIGIASQWDAPGRSALDHMAEAVHGALADAGLRLSDVDGLFAASSSHAMPTVTIGEYLGLRPAYSDSNTIGGASFVQHLLGAALALEAGLCEVALICYGSNQRSASGRLVSMSEPQPYESPYEPRYPIMGFALAAARHMYQYGTTREQLAEVAVAARAWARHNPEAFDRGPLTVDDVLTSRMVHDPLTSRDCCLVTDGGAAIIMTRADRARDMPRPPIYLLGAAAAHWHRQIASMPDLTVTAATESGPKAFEMAGVARSEVDVLQLYDAFTINTILFLEDLGFCPKGEGGRFVENGRIAPGGLAVNTNGGGLSCNHPGMYSLFMVIEAVRQLRGTAVGLQVPEARIALCHGNGGPLSSQATAIFATEPNR
jgi:acetyl-CoA acetyltransferase